MKTNRGYDVVLVVPPFREMDKPTLGVSILASACKACNLKVKVFYADLALAKILGYAQCEKLASRSELSQSVFRWFALKGELKPENPRVFFERLLEIHAEEVDFRNPKMTNADGRISVDDLICCLERIPEYLDFVCDRILAWSPALVGFSCLFSQSLAAIAIAGRLKQLSPDLLLVLGGAVATAPMGGAFRKLTPSFDFVFSGESENEFPQFARNYVDSGDLPADRIVTCGQLADLDAGAMPDYEDYFLQIEEGFRHSRDEKPVVNWIPFQTSSGCYRAKRHPCTFCGLNADAQGYRYKSPQRAVREILHLAHTYDVPSLLCADTILPSTYFRDVLPVLAKLRPADLEIFYEIQSGLTPRQLDLCVKAGLVIIQPGIETLSNSILKLIHKGITSTQNLCLLRDCLSRQIRVWWNFLLGIPGDEREDYEAMIRLIPKIEHFQPPMTWRAVSIDRFSSYFCNPRDYGITHIRPRPDDELIFFEHENLDQIAYRFTGDFESAFRQDKTLADSMVNELGRWNALWGDSNRRPTLRIFNVDRQTKAVQDTRTCGVESVYLPTLTEVELLEFCERPKRPSEIPSDLSDSLPTLLERHYIVDYENMFTTLVTDPTIGFRLRQTESPGKNADGD